MKTDRRTQFGFPWACDDGHNRRSRTRKRHIRHSRPPKIGAKVAFEARFGIETGVLQRIHQGLVCQAFVMTDGRVAMDYELVMGETSPWRDLDSVTAEERKACEERIRAAHEAEPNKDFREIPLGWNDLCQYMTYLRLKTAKDRERKKHGLMESTHPPILPS